MTKIVEIAMILSYLPRVFSVIFNPAVACRDDFGVGIVGAMQFVRNGGIDW